MKQRKARPGFYPFWFWNDRIEPAELRRQIGEMADKGIRGFFIHPRQGLGVPYLSDAFLDLVELAVQAAEERGLVVHLYDEYPYPSGVAGGEVVLGNPHYCATALSQGSVTHPGGTLRMALPAGKILNCTAFPVNGDAVEWNAGIDLTRRVGILLANNHYVVAGLTPYNRKRYMADNPTPVLEAELPPSPHVVSFSVQVTVSAHKYWGLFVDTLNPEAIQTFIRLTHERYRARLGDRFGRSILSIFVDETAPGWSETLPRAFRETHGYDLLPLLPALHDERHPEHHRVNADLGRIKLELFVRSFDKPIADWCRSHNLLYAGEKNHLRLSQLRYMDVPGGDPGHVKAGAPSDLLTPGIRQNARAVASAAYFYGKQDCLVECCHSLGWSATLQDVKMICEGLLLEGITWLVPHAFFYSSHALRKHDGPPSFFFQMPYWPHFGALAERVDRIAAHFEGTWIDARILIVEPTPGLPSPQDRDAYARLMATLAERRHEFMIVDVDMLEDARIDDGCVRIRDVTAGVVLVPPMRLPEAALERQLSRLDGKGVHVIRCAPDFDAGALVAAVEQHVPPCLSLRAVSGDAAPIRTVVRTDGRQTRWFLLNRARSAVELHIERDEPLHECPLDDQPPLLASVKGGYRRTLRPFESVLLASGTGDPPETVETVRIPVAGPTRVRPLGPNLLRLYNWTVRIVDGDGQEGPGSATTAIPVANQIAEAGLAFTPRVRTAFGQSPQLGLPLLHLRYRTTFECRYDGPVQVVMEPGSIVGEWELRINGGPPLAPADFAPVPVLVHGCLGVDVGARMRQGPNTLQVDVRTDCMDGGLLNALYLAGDFAVTLQPVTLTQQRPDGAFEAWEENGLPFFAGVVEYETSFTLTAPPAAGRVLAELDIDDGFGDACEFAVNDGPWHAVPWSPRRTLVDGSEFVRNVNQLRLRVYTSLIRAFEGQTFDPERHACRDVGGRTENPPPAARTQPAAGKPSREGT